MKKNNVIERKIRYDGTVAEYNCKPLRVGKNEAVLFYRMEKSVSLHGGEMRLTIPEGSDTFSFYWTDRPYNLYIWRNPEGGYAGSYFNIVRNTHISERAVSYEDLIVDILVLPDGHYCVLDQDELPEPLPQFEQGYVDNVLRSLTGSLGSLLPPFVLETENMKIK